MKKLTYLIVILSLQSAFICDAQQLTKKATFIEKVEKKEGKFIVPYEKYKLDNGLTLIINEDHSDPMVQVEVLYNVGSSRDEQGRYGFAHFFEHMMFEGSDHVGAGELQKFVNEVGGKSNGNTTMDYTRYYETVPSNCLETVLWMEADRMGFFLDAITPKKFEIQRATVKNERGENTENQPYGLSNEKVMAALYPIDNPYSTPTIGYREDIDRADVNELKRFFLRWYGPNNAILVISGDVKPEDVVKLTEKYFGSINPGPKAGKVHTYPVELKNNRYISYEDNIRNPLLEIVYPTVPVHDKDEAPLDLLADLIGGSGHSRLYTKFGGIPKPRTSSVSAYQPCLAGAGKFRVSLTLLPDENLADAEEDVHKVFDEFERYGATEDDLIKFKSERMRQFFERIETVSGKAEWLAYYEWLHGNPNMFQAEYDRYMKVTADDVMAAYRKYIKDKPAVVLSVYPKGKSKHVASKDNYTIPQRKGLEPEEWEYKNLEYKKSVDDFDRSKKPLPGPDPIVKLPEIWEQTLYNGVKLMGIYTDEIPSVTLQLSFDAGHSKEGYDQAGIASLATSLFNESTESHYGNYYSKELRKLGSEIYEEYWDDDIKVIVKSPIESLDRTLNILKEKLLSIKLVAKEFEWEKNKHLERIAIRSKEIDRIADNTFYSVLYGKKNINGYPIQGTTATIRDISFGDVKKYYAECFAPGNCNIQIVGDVKKEDILKKLSFLSDWKPQAAVKNTPDEPKPVIHKTRLYFVNKENAAQSEIRIGTTLLPYDPLGEQYKCTVMNDALGGGFNARINQNLREANGYSYGANSHIYSSKYSGQFLAEASVNTAHTDSSVMQMMKEIKLYADSGITNAELAKAKKSFVLKEALKYESQDQKANFLWRLMYFNLDKNFFTRQHDILNSLNKEEIDALAKKYLPYNNMVILVVGDKSIYPKLQKLGYETVELFSDK